MTKPIDFTKLPVDHCESIMTAYRTGAGGPEAKARMVASIQSLAAQLQELVPRGEVTRSHILRLVEAVSLLRYGSDAGTELYGEVLDAFTGTTGGVMPS